MDKFITVYMVKNGIVGSELKGLFDRGYETAESLYYFSEREKNEFFKSLAAKESYAFCLGFKAQMLDPDTIPEVAEPKKLVRDSIISRGICKEKQIIDFYKGYEKASRMLKSNLSVNEVESMESMVTPFETQAWCYGVRARLDEMEEGSNVN